MRASFPRHIKPGREASSPSPEAITVAVACQILGLGRTKLYELMADGTLPSVKLGGRRLVRLETIHRLIAQLEQLGLEKGAASIVTSAVTEA